jgi:phosphatidylinositol alpha-1,6-mannosyltransferase
MSRAHQWLPIPRRPSLAFIHGIEVWTGTSHPKQVAAAPRMTHLLANSQHTRDRAAELDPRFARAEVCWLATESDDPPACTPRTDGPPRVTIVGRIVADRYKGHDELFRAWPAVIAAVPDAILTVAGTGPALPQFQKLAAELGLPQKQVEFRGFVPEAEMPKLWAETTVFAMPSRGEGFGLVYIEAMRHSVPVIGSIHDAAPEVNLDGVTGYNVDLTRTTELAERLIQLLRNRDESTALGANGFRRWQSEFRYSAFRSRFEPILDRFLRR